MFRGRVALGEERQRLLSQPPLQEFGIYDSFITLEHLIVNSDKGNRWKEGCTCYMGRTIFLLKQSKNGLNY